jgi:hypothetical protein
VGVAVVVHVLMVHGGAKVRDTSAFLENFSEAELSLANVSKWLPLRNGCHHVKSSA